MNLSRIGPSGTIAKDNMRTRIVNMQAKMTSGSTFRARNNICGELRSYSDSRIYCVMIVCTTIVLIDIHTTTDSAERQLSLRS